MKMSGRREQEQPNVKDYYDEEEDEEPADDNGEHVDEDEPIHPDLIAAAQEMGLDLNSQQMRDLQYFIAQQNINEESDEEAVDAQGDDDDD